MRGHVRKRKNSWAVVLYVGVDARTGKKIYKWFSHRTRQEAEAHLTQLLAQVQAGRGIPPTRLRLGEFLDQWLRDYAASHVAPATFRNYEDTVRVHISPAIGHIPSLACLRSSLSGISASGSARAASVPRASSITTGS